MPEYNSGSAEIINVLGLSYPRKRKRTGNKQIIGESVVMTIRQFHPVIWNKETTIHIKMQLCKSKVESIVAYREEVWMWE